MTDPAHSTDPRWIAQEARRQALEEAAALVRACTDILTEAQAEKVAGRLEASDQRIDGAIKWP
jgi:hypothetical protein